MNIKCYKCSNSFEPLQNETTCIFCMTKPPKQQADEMARKIAINHSVDASQALHRFERMKEDVVPLLEHLFECVEACREISTHTNSLLNALRECEQHEKDEESLSYWKHEIKAHYKNSDLIRTSLTNLDNFLKEREKE